jgi:hypothetical protein
MLGKELLSEGCDGNERTATRASLTLHESAVIGFLPYGEPGAGGTPSSHDLGVCPRLRSDPRQQVENQRVQGVGGGAGHCRLSFWMSERSIAHRNAD